jgi:hypothetical protein
MTNLHLRRHHSWMVLLRGWTRQLWRELDACCQVQSCRNIIGVKLCWLQFILSISHQVIHSKEMFLTQSIMVRKPDMIS